MTKDQLVAWANDPQRQDTLPYGLYEPLEQKAIVGAALVVRGALYFKGGHTKSVRKTLADCYTRYLDAIDEYSALLAKASEQPVPATGVMRWFYEEGHKPVEFAKARGFRALANDLPGSQVLVSATSSADNKLATGFFEFSAFCIPDWQAELGTRGLDALAFSVPRRFLELCPGKFESLFGDFASALPIVWGHAGIGVNLPFLNPEANEASENFWSRLYGLGVDVGDPLSTSIRRITDKIKTVDWLTVLSADLTERVGGVHALMLPPDWFRKTVLANGALLIQSGVNPVAGVPRGKGIPPAPPAAYVLLNHALRKVVADTSGILQRGTVNSTAPLLNTVVSSEAWLQRLNVPEDDINGYWVELHKTPKLG
jgi:hypothetical protein